MLTSKSNINKAARFFSKAKIYKLQIFSLFLTSERKCNTPVPCNALNYTVQRKQLGGSPTDNVNLNIHNYNES